MDAAKVRRFGETSQQVQDFFAGRSYIPVICALAEMAWRDATAKPINSEPPNHGSIEELVLRNPCCYSLKDRWRSERARSLHHPNLTAIEPDERVVHHTACK